MDHKRNVTSKRQIVNYVNHWFSSSVVFWLGPYNKSITVMLFYSLQCQNTVHIGKLSEVFLNVKTWCIWVNCQLWLALQRLFSKAGKDVFRNNKDKH